MALPLVYHPDYVSHLPDGHRFPMAKFGLLYEVLVRDGVAEPGQFHCPEPARFEQITLAHDAAYVEAYLTGAIDPRAMRRIGLPWSAALANRTCAALGGSILSARLAMRDGLAANLAGGTHHAFPDYGAGYCVFNDLAIAPRVLQQEGLIRSALIVDLDVHQGDGSAAILADDASIFTFSMHCAANFPFRKQRSDLDVELPAGMEDEPYLSLLQQHLPAVLASVQPDLVLYDAGVDLHKEDRLGKLALTDEGLYRRDFYVVDECVRRGIPVSCVIGGGYDRDLQALARRHSIVFRAASDVCTPRAL